MSVFRSLDVASSLGRCGKALFNLVLVRGGLCSGGVFSEGALFFFAKEGVQPHVFVLGVFYKGFG